MANEFKIKKGLIVTGASGGTVVDIQGSQGQLFSVTDDLSGSIFAVSDISGVPIFDVNSSGLSTFDGNVNLPDNNKLTLGTGNDLEIYHDGSHSYIRDQGSGNLIITGSQLTFSNVDDTEYMVKMVQDGSVELYYDGSKKLETTSTGVSITGTISADDNIYLDGVAPVLNVSSSNNASGFRINVTDIADSTNNLLRVQRAGTTMIDTRGNGNTTFTAQAFSAATSSGDVSSTLTTKGYVDGLITGATIYRGAWQAGISATSSAATTASTTLTVTAAILDADSNTPVLVGAVVTGAGITGIVKVASVTSSTVYVLDTAITATATAYIFSPIYGAPDLSGVTETSGYYYICSEAGSATPNGANSEPNTWAVGDWCIYNDVSGTGQWQKIDNSSVLSGVGTGQTVALWEGPSSVTDSETLGNAPITVSGNDTTFAGQITGQDSGSVQLNLKRGSSGTDGNTSILFTQPLGNGYIGVDATGAFSYNIAADLTGSKFKVDRSGNATFAGDIDLTAGQLELRGDVALDHDGSSLYVKAPASIYLLPGNTNKGNINAAGLLTIAGGGTFGGNVTASNFYGLAQDLAVTSNDTFSGTYSLLWHDGADVYSSTWMTVTGSNDTLTVPTIAADLNGTINTATTGFTQTAGNNSTKIATTAYADAAAGAVPIGNYLPLAGGTLTGGLLGTTANFSSHLTALTFKSTTTTLNLYSSGSEFAVNLDDSVHIFGTGFTGTPRMQPATTAEMDLGYSAGKWKNLYLSGNIFSDGSGDNYLAGNVGIGTTNPKAKLDVNGRFCVDSKTHNLTNAFTTCLTVNLNSHAGCYVTLTCFGDWGSHSAAAYRGEFFLQNGANAYAEPGIILRQDDNTSNGTDQIVCQIVDPTGSGNPKDFEIQIRTTATTGTTAFTGQLTYTVQGKFNSIT